jgi:hypothetical protein
MLRKSHYTTPTLNQPDIKSIAEKYSLNMREVSLTECLDCAGIGIEMVKGKVEVHRVSAINQRDTGLTGGRGKSLRRKTKGLDL